MSPLETSTAAALVALTLLPLAACKSSSSDARPATQPATGQVAPAESAGAAAGAIPGANARPTQGVAPATAIPAPVPAPAASAAAATTADDRPVPAFHPFVDPGTTRDRFDLAALTCAPGTGVFDPRSTEVVACVKLPVPKGEFPVRHGRAVWFHGSGRVHEMGQYAEHKREGVWAAWDEDGNRKSIVTYAGDAYDGLYVTWWPNGRRQSEIEWRAGKKHGLARTWADDGTLLSEQRYQDDQAAGR